MLSTFSSNAIFFEIICPDCKSFIERDKNITARYYWGFHALESNGNFLSKTSLRIQANNENYEAIPRPFHFIRRLKFTVHNHVTEQDMKKTRVFIGNWLYQVPGGSTELEIITWLPLINSISLNTLEINQILNVGKHKSEWS